MMNDPRQVFKTLSELYQFHKKLAQVYHLSRAKPLRIAESPAPAPRPAKPQKRRS